MSDRILVVEDDDSVSYPLRIFLESSGFRVDLADEMPQALTLLGLADYAVVLSDLRLRGAGSSEGIDLLRFVRKTRPRTRTVLLTGYSSEEFDREARESGADLVVRKPQSLPWLLDCIRDLLRERRA